MLPYRIPSLRNKRAPKPTVTPSTRPSTGAADMQAFLGQWAKRPLNVASITPSSRRLADLVTSEVRANEGPILVLGPGTGVFPKALLRRGVAQENMALIELNPRFFELLSKRFPDIHIINANAATADLDAFGFDAPFKAAISGLGFLSMKRHVVRDILRNCFEHLDDDAALYQFTYGWRCPVPADIMKELGLRAQKIGWVAMNMPPARVYKISRA